MSVAAPEKVLSLHDRVLDASVWTYRVSGLETWTREQTHGWAIGTQPFDLIIPKLRRVEEVETADSLAAINLQRLAECQRSGLDVWVLVPLKEVGRAQDRLRGVAGHVQAWWVEKDRVLFGEPRLL